VLLFLTAVQAYAQTPSVEKAVLVLQTGSTEGYCRLAFSPDGKWLASSSEHGPVILWDAATGVKVREFPPVSASITQKLPTGGILTHAVRVGRGGLAFSPDGKYIASSGKSNRDIMNGGTWSGKPLPVPPAIWEVASGKPAGEGSWTVGEDGVAHNPNSPWAPNEVVAWQFAKDEVTARQFTSYFGPAQTISDNGLVGAGITDPRDKAAIEIYEVPSNRKIATLPGTFLNPGDLALSADGKYLALKYQGYGLEVWDLSTLRLVATLDAKSWTADAETFSPDGKYFAASGDGDTVHIFETGTWKEIFSESYKQVYGIHELAFSPDSKRLAGVDFKLHVWDVQALREVYEIGGTPFRPISALAASPDSQRLAVALQDGEYSSTQTEPRTVIEMWPLRGGAPEVLPKKTFEIDEISFSPDSTKLAASGQELATETNMHNGVNTYSIGGDLLLWDVTQKREIKVKAQEGTSVAAYGPNVSFSANGKQIVTGALVPLRRNSSSPESDEEQESASYARLLMIVDPQTGLTADELRVGRGNALLLTQSPDGQHVITANEQTLRSWDIVNHKLDAKFEPKLDPAGEAAGHAESPAQQYRKFGENYQDPAVAALRYTPDGKSLLVAEEQGPVLLLDASTGAEIKRESLATTVRAFAYSPDGKHLASAQSGATPRVWDSQSLTSRELEAHDEDCLAVAFSADGSTIVCGGDKGVILVWDAASRSLVARILRASDGRWLVITPEGLFDGTPSGNGLATWRLGNRSFAIDQWPKSFRHEGLLQELLAGKRPKPKEELASVLNASAH
ncbi:MAG: WD40 repeat domain-containing protein, partial [Candidatus Acidiferrum sp.]